MPTPARFGEPDFLNPHLCIDLGAAGYFTGFMRALPVVVSVLIVLACGCAGSKHPAGAAGFPDVQGGRQKLIVTPETTPIGKVVKANPAGRFVVLNFPLGRFPAMGERLSLYRQGLKVGEVKVTGPQYEDNIVADVAAGEAALGDEARAP